ncbi:MAG: hypothetical protein AAGG48_14715 [Planctomycetota bacterium]
MIYVVLFLAGVIVGAFASLALSIRSAANVAANMDHGNQPDRPTEKEPPEFGTKWEPMP